MNLAGLRAALIGFAVLIYGVAASPLPRSVKASDFDNPIAQAELRQWSGLLAGFGIALSPEEFQALAIEVGQELAGLRTDILTPFRPWFRVTGTGQGWALFSYPDTHPYRLVIEGRGADREWRTLFSTLDPEADWLRGPLRFRRLRGVYDGTVHRKDPGALYDRFVEWVARRALDDHPEIDAVRIYMEQLHSPLPDQTSKWKTKKKFTQVHTRRSL